MSKRITRKVCEEDKKDCEREITTEEIIQAINQLRVRKSPGVDVLEVSFTKFLKKKCEIYEEVKKKKE